MADTNDANRINAAVCGNHEVITNQINGTNTVIFGDGCDDCAATSNFNPLADGPDLDSDGLCNDGDPDADGDGVENVADLDDDNDGVPDISDTNSVNPFICGDREVWVYGGVTNIGDGADNCV